MKTIAITLVSIISLFSIKLQAQEKTIENKTTYSIETDPSTFIFKGFAFHVRIKPKNSQHLVIGAGTYALNMPSFLVNMNPDNKEKGWNVRINSALSLFGEYYFKEANNKLFIGLQTGIQNFKNTNSNIANKENKYSNILIMPSVGYNWKPFNNGFYVKPWLGIGYTTKIYGDESSYKISPIAPFLTIHIGYTFN